MGWAGHEYQWRGANPEIGTRLADITTIYTTADNAAANKLLRKYNVRYVVVGDTEHTIKGASPASLRKFAMFMRVAYRFGGTLIYTW
jgi:uncharacterized membrane protein